LREKVSAKPADAGLKDVSAAATVDAGCGLKGLSTPHPTASGGRLLP
jgi:hypothetical protein